MLRSWEIDGETVETVSDLIFWGSKITADGDCSHEIKKRLLLEGILVMTNLRQHIKKQRHSFANKGPSGQGYGFSGSHENWTIKKAEHQRTDAFELWYWKDSREFLELQD